MPRGYTIAQIVLSALGVIDSGMVYLLDTHNKSVDVPCTPDGGCEKVAESAYSQVTIAGHTVEVAMIGIVGYIVLLTLAMMKAASETRRAVDLISIALTTLTFGGFLYSIYLQYQSFVIIKAHCLYCIISASVMTALFIVSAFERRALKSSGPVAG